MGTYEVTRTVHIAASRERVHSLLDDFHRWPEWSPWEDLDPELSRTYAGADSGPGARYAWSGNKKAGEGTMEILSSSPEQVCVAVTFLKPFASSSTSIFELVERAGGTDVTWRMVGEQRGLMGLIGKLVPMEKFIGKDFDKGLSQLKTAAEK